MTKGDNKKEISSFKWSPSGQHIAFISSDEKSADQEAREKETVDARVYGESWEYNRLRLLHLGTREVATLVIANVHVTDFAWSGDSKEIAYVTQKTPDINSAGYNGVQFSRVSLASKKNEVIGEKRFPGPAHDLAWSGGDLFFLAGAAPNMSNTSSCVYKLLLVSGAWEKYAHGDVDCVYSLRSIAWNTRRAIVLHVLAGLNDRITLIRFEDSKDQAISPHSNHELETWDAAIGPTPNENTIQVVGYSTASKPTEIYLFRKTNFCQLSNNGQAVAKFNIGEAGPLHCKASDGAPCDGVFVRPTNAEKGQTTTDSRTYTRWALFPNQCLLQSPLLLLGPHASLSGLPRPLSQLPRWQWVWGGLRFTSTRCNGNK